VVGYSASLGWLYSIINNNWSVTLCVSMNSNYYQIVPQTYEEKVEMYMKLEKKEIIDMLIEANNIIDRLTKHPVPIEFPSGQQKPWKTCTSWSDCTNPHKDCINCPLRYKQSDFANTWSNK
jgi:hypothetical protein